MIHSKLTGILERENITEENVPELKQMSPKLGYLLSSLHNTSRHITVNHQARNKHFTGLQRGKTNDIQAGHSKTEQQWKLETAVLLRC